MLTRVVTWMRLMTVWLVSSGCNKGEQPDQPFSGVGARPDVLPVMLNKELPFRYPPALYAKKVQANVTLRVFIDKEGLASLPSQRMLPKAPGFHRSILRL